MGRVALLPLVFLTLTMRISGSLLPITTPATGELVQQLEEYMKIKVNELKLGLHEAFERDRIRNKRSADALYEITARDVIKEDQYMVKDAKSERTHPLSKFNISAVTSVGHRENDLLILATYSGSLIILKFDNHYFNVWTTVDGNEVAVKVKHFIYRGQLWLVALQYRKSKYFVQTYSLERNLLHKRQTIVLEGLSDIDLILNNGIFYLGVSTYNRQTQMG
ncbi:uncharacterized protein LOC143223847 [Tachypleus tridentatus]|uniref:uncharacterized protein LOC143223847 n=1 Tax=Tachypleus tridentatus TaxID=6853 RepID=UPI003FD0B1B5